jgi:hypothetical protein
VWESLVVNLGYRSSSLFGEEFLSTPIHSPLSGHLIGPPDMQCDELEEDCVSFIRDMADAALKDLELLPQDAQRTRKTPRPQVNCIILCFM